MNEIGTTFLTFFSAVVIEVFDRLIKKLWNFSLFFFILAEFM